MLDNTIKIYNKMKEDNLKDIYMSQFKYYDYINLFRLQKENHNIVNKVNILENTRLILYKGYTEMCPIIEINNKSCVNINAMISELFYLSESFKKTDLNISRDLLKTAINIEKKSKNYCS